MVAFFNMDGKLDFSIASLKFETRTLADITAFTLMIFVGKIHFHHGTHTYEEYQ